MAIYPAPYPARLEIDYPKRLSRLTTLLRPILAIPIAVILFLLNASGDISIQAEKTATTSAGFMSYLALATALMIVFRYRYPRWWFEFARELVRFSARVSAYLLLLTDQYPSTVEEQSVHLEIDYPDVKHELNRWLPLVK
jgi:amino acid transporter